MVRPSLMIALSLCLWADAFAQDRVVSFGGGELDLGKAAWKFKPGDDAAWASASLDDSGWETLAGSGIRLDRMPRSGWNGVGWFRLRIRAEGAFARQPLALVLVHFGASEVYLDGRLMQRNGVVGATPEEEHPFNPNAVPLVIALDDAPGGHVLAVRHSAMELRDMSGGWGKWFARQSERPVASAYTNRTTNYGAGFGASLMPAPQAQGSWAERNAAGGLYLLNFGLLSAVGLLHFLLFWFYPRDRANLYFAVFACAAAASNIIYYRWLLSHQSAAGIYFQLSLNITLTRIGQAALMGFVYSALAFPPKRWFWIWLGASALYVPVSLTFVEMGEARRWYSHALTLFPVVEVARGMVRAAREKTFGAWAVGLGLLVYTAYDALSAIALVRGIPASPLARNVSVLMLTVAISVFLARRFARISLAEADLRTRHERERMENERRARELEEARQLQISMLPKQVPQYPGVEIAAYMKPASEVGGDYYDFHVSDDGLTIALGDATGHGLKAGTMVTAVKSLFVSMASESDPARMLECKNRALRQMKWKGLFMAMMVVKLRQDRLSFSNAGLPSLLVYRAANGVVEEVKAQAPPLGASANRRYETRELVLSPGDVVLLMSDGLPERFNESMEMLDYATVQREFEAAARGSSQEIIERLVQAGEAWSGGRAQDDDVTLVVVRCVSR